jgi:AraC-like DNA-binding protein
MILWFCWASIVLGLFLIIPLLRRSKAKGPDLWLTLFLLALIFSEGAGVLVQTGRDRKYLFLWVLFVTPEAAFAPLMYHYARRVAGFRFRRVELWNYFPTLLWFMILVRAAVLVTLKPGLLAAPRPHSFDWISFVLEVQASIYIPFIARTILKHHRRIKEEGVLGRHRDLVWLVFLLGGAIVLWGLWLWSTLMPNHMMNDFEQASMVVFFYAVGWFGWHQEASPSPPPAKKKYGKSGMSAQDEALVAERMVRYIEGDRAFLDEDLTLGKVAQAVGCSPQWVSEYLNKTLSTTFFDYINGQRVHEFLRLATSQGAEWSVLDLAMAAGFRSRSTFNLAFKKKTGLTPTEWLKQLRQ